MTTDQRSYKPLHISTAVSPVIERLFRTASQRRSAERLAGLIAEIERAKEERAEAAQTAPASLSADVEAAPVRGGASMSAPLAREVVKAAE